MLDIYSIFLSFVYLFHKLIFQCANKQVKKTILKLLNISVLMSYTSKRFFADTQIFQENSHITLYYLFNWKWHLNKHVWANLRNCGILLVVILQRTAEAVVEIIEMPIDSCGLQSDRLFLFIAVDEIFFYKYRNDAIDIENLAT